MVATIFPGAPDRGLMAKKLPNYGKDTGMLRISLAAAVTVLAAGFTGCTHCDTCDDFPVPCVGHNTGVPVGPGQSYTMNVGPEQSTIVSAPASPAGAAANSAPVPPTSSGPFKPPVASSSGGTASPSLEPLPRSSDVTPPPPASLGSAKAN